MKKLILIISLFFTNSFLFGQAVVSDPVHTGVTTLIKLFQDPSFKTMVKQIEDLKKVSSAVQQFHRGTEIIQTIQKTSQKISVLSNAVAKDGHIYPAEYQNMLADMGEMAKVGTNIIKDMKSATTQQGGVLKMSDGERMTWLNSTYSRVKSFEVMVNSYFAKVQNMSLRRSGNRTDLTSTSKLYTMSLPSVVGVVGTGGSVTMSSNGYDNGYVDDKSSVLDSAYKSNEAKKIKEMQKNCMTRIQNYYDEKSIVEANMEREAFVSLMNKGWDYKAKKPKFNFQTLLNLNAITTVTSAYDQIQNINSLNNGTTTSGSSNISATIDDAIQGFVDPNGQYVSNEQFMVYLRIEARELMLTNNVDEKLRTKWKLDECSSLGLY